MKSDEVFTSCYDLPDIQCKVMRYALHFVSMHKQDNSLDIIPSHPCQLHIPRDQVKEVCTYIVPFMFSYYICQ